MTGSGDKRDIPRHQASTLETGSADERDSPRYQTSLDSGRGSSSESHRQTIHLPSEPAYHRDRQLG